MCSDYESPFLAISHFPVGLTLPRLYLMFGVRRLSQSPRDKLDNMKRFLPMCCCNTEMTPRAVTSQLYLWFSSSFCRHHVNL